MSDKEFRFIIVAEKYDDSVRFYRDGLGLPIKETWDNGASDRGTSFEASSGIIEVVSPPLFSDPAAEILTSGRPQGTTIGVEVEKVEMWYERVRTKGLPLKRGLSDLPWGHRGFSVTDPSGISIYMFSMTQE